MWPWADNRGGRQIRPACDWSIGCWWNIGCSGFDTRDGTDVTGAMAELRRGWEVRASSLGGLELESACFEFWLPRTMKL